MEAGVRPRGSSSTRARSRRPAPQAIARHGRGCRAAEHPRCPRGGDGHGRWGPLGLRVVFPSRGAEVGLLVEITTPWNERRRWGRAFAATLTFMLAQACAEAPRPNVLLVTFDTTRFDHLGCTGDPEARTPVVDSLAARGLLFERAYAPVALTLPSHATLHTGLEPIGHGVHDNGHFVLSPEVPTLAEVLSEAGYDTGAFVSAFVLHHRYGLDQGFGAYGDDVRSEGTGLAGTVPQRPGAEVVDAAATWLAARRPERPFFLWAHFYDPHEPRKAETSVEGIDDGYRAEIAYADAHLGRLLEHVQRAGGGRSTLIVFTADHGESLGEHGEATHGLVAYDSTLHVPLVLVGPRVPAGARSRALARHVDVMPTVLEALGLSGPKGLPGRDLLRAARAGREQDADWVVGWFEARGQEFALGWAPIEGVRSGRWKYTATPDPPELYDVAVDPSETRNRVADRPEVAERMARRFRELRAAQAAPERGQRRELGLEEAEQLAALGYVEAAGSIAAGERPDPRRFVAVHGWVERARSRARAGAYAEAIEVLEALAESPSVRPLVLRTLAPVYREAGRLDDAISAYRRYVELSGADEARVGLARALIAAGRAQEALTVLAGVSAAVPSVVTARATALSRLGRHADARAALDAGLAGRSLLRAQHRASLELDAAPQPDGEAEMAELLELAPNDPVVKSRVGLYRVLFGRGPREGALALLRDAAAAAPDNAELQGNLGWGAFRLDDEVQAEAALEAALALDPARQIDRLRLAFVLRAAGRHARALGLVRAALAASPGAPWAPEARALEGELRAALGPQAQGDPT